jgi:hypothetical protein
MEEKEKEFTNFVTSENLPAAVAFLINEVLEIKRFLTANDKTSIEESIAKIRERQKAAEAKIKDLQDEGHLPKNLVYK